MATKRRRGSNPLATIGLVVGIHVALGGAVFMIGKTQTGREIMHKIQLYEPPPPPTEDIVQPPPPPPKTPPPVEAKIEAPKINSVAPAAPAASARVDIGSNLGGTGGGGGWSGGKFNAGGGGGPLGAFHSCVMRSYRSCLGSWSDLRARAELEIRVNGSGKVVGSRVTRSTGNAENDRVLSAALECAERDLRCHLPPEEQSGAVITMKLSPSAGGIRAEP